MSENGEQSLLADLNALSEIRKTSDSGSAKDETICKMNPVDQSEVPLVHILGKAYTNNPQGVQGSMSIGSKSKSTSNVGTTPKGDGQK